MKKGSARHRLPAVAVLNNKIGVLMTNKVKFEEKMANKDNGIEQVFGELEAMRRELAQLEAKDIQHNHIEDELLKFKMGIERSGEAIFITDINGTITYVNPAFEKIYGFSKEEALGKTPRILKSGVAPVEIYQQFWSALLAKQVVSGELINKTKDGRLINIESSANPIIGEDGKIIGFLAVQRDITERKQAEEKLRTMSLTDELTGLYNRRGFMLLAEQQLKTSHRTMKSLLLLYMDLDNMKWINDTKGHQVGDLALNDVADILRKNFRESDIIARIGGDEFVVLALDIPKGIVDKLVTRLKKNIESHNARMNRSYRCSLSIGVAHHDAKSPQTIDALLKEADRLMYQDKQKKQKNNHV